MAQHVAHEISAEQTLDVATALSVVADEASWVPAGESAYAIGLTKSGDEELRREAAGRRVSA